MQGPAVELLRDEAGYRLGHPPLDGQHDPVRLVRADVEALERAATEQISDLLRLGRRDFAGPFEVFRPSLDLVVEKRRKLMVIADEDAALGAD